MQMMTGQESPRLPKKHPVKAGIATLANCPTIFMLPERVPQNRPPMSEQAVQLGGITRSLQKLEQPMATIAQTGFPIKADAARKKDAPVNPIEAILLRAFPATPIFLTSQPKR